VAKNANSKFHIRKCLKKKLRFDDEAEALRRISSLRYRFPENPFLNTYKCFICSGWHLTRNAQR
jgi:hypothetical protein